MIKKCVAQFSSIPEYNESQILVARQILEKGVLETATDFILTFGNQRYVETYYRLKKEGEQTYINEVQYINESCADDLKAIYKEGFAEFDIRPLVKMRMENDVFDLNKRNSTSSDKKNIFIQFLKVGVYTQFMKQTTFQTFKVMNNALLKKGAKQFILIGGRQMMKVGTEITMKQGSKVIGNAVVKQVTHQGGKRATLTVAQTAISWGTLGLSLVAQAGYSYVKSVANSGWLSEEKVVIQVQNQFNFTQIYEDEEVYQNDKTIMTSFNQSQIFLGIAVQEIKEIKQKCKDFRQQLGDNLPNLFQFFRLLKPIVNQFNEMQFEEILKSQIQMNDLIKINVDLLQQFNQIQYSKILTETKYYLFNTQITDSLNKSLQLLNLLSFFSDSQIVVKALL